MRVRASDEREGNIVEAGIDRFKAQANVLENTLEIDPNWILTARPSPFAEELILEAEENEESQLIITDLMGRILVNQRFSTSESINTKSWNSGMYIIQVRSKNRYSPVTKVVKP